MPDKTELPITLGTVYSVGSNGISVLSIKDYDHITSAASVSMVFLYARIQYYIILHWYLLHM